MIRSKARAQIANGSRRLPKYTATAPRAYPRKKSRVRTRDSAQISRRKGAILKRVQAIRKKGRPVLSLALLFALS